MDKKKIEECQIKQLIREVIADELEIEVKHKSEKHFGADKTSNEVEVSLYLDDGDDRKLIHSDCFYFDTED